MPDPLRLQKRLIEILENAEGNVATAAEAKGELDDEGLAYTVEQIRAAMDQLVVLGRARRAPHVPGAPVGYQLSSAPPIEPPAERPRVSAAQPVPPPAGALKPHALILAAIAEKPGRIIELSERTGLSQALIGYHVKLLAAEGKIEREADKRTDPWRLVGTRPQQVSRETTLPPPGGRSSCAQGQTAGSAETHWGSIREDQQQSARGFQRTDVTPKRSSADRAPHRTSQAQDQGARTTGWPRAQAARRLAR